MASTHTLLICEILEGRVGTYYGQPGEYTSCDAWRRAAGERECTKVSVLRRVSECTYSPASVY